MIRTDVSDSENNMVTVFPTYLKIRGQKLSNFWGYFSVVFLFHPLSASSKNLGSWLSIFVLVIYTSEI